MSIPETQLLAYVPTELSAGDTKLYQVLHRSFSEAAFSTRCEEYKEG